MIPRFWGHKTLDYQPQKRIREMCCLRSSTNLVAWTGIIYDHTAWFLKFEFELCERGHKFVLPQLKCWKNPRNPHTFSWIKKFHTTSRQSAPFHAVTKRCTYSVTLQVATNTLHTCPSDISGYKNTTLPPRTFSADNEINFFATNSCDAMWTEIVTEKGGMPPGRLATQVATISEISVIVDRDGRTSRRKTQKETRSTDKKQ